MHALLKYVTNPWRSTSILCTSMPNCKLLYMYKNEVQLINEKYSSQVFALFVVQDSFYSCFSERQPFYSYVSWVQKFPCV